MGKNLNVSKPVLLGFIGTFIILTILTVFSVSSTRRLISTAGLFTHRLTVLNHADLVLKSIVDMESGERGYVISGQEDFIDPLHHTTAPLLAHVDKLDSLTMNDSIQHRRVDTLRNLVETKIAWIDRVIASRKISFDSAKFLVGTKTGKLSTDSIRACVKRIQDAESATFQTQNTMTNSSLVRIQYSFVSLSLAVMVVIVVLFYMINRTLNARSLAEQKLKQSASEIHDLYNHAPCGYYAVDAALTLTTMNKTLLDWLGYAEEEVIGKLKFPDLLSPNDKLKFDAAFNTGFDEYKHRGFHRDQEHDFVRKNGTILPISLSSVAVYDEQGKFLKSRSTVSDNTERKKLLAEVRQHNENLESQVAERTEELQESQFIYRNIAANIPDSAVLLLDRDGKYIVAEGELLADMGYDTEALLNTNIASLLPGDTYALYKTMMDDAFEGRKTNREMKTVSGNYHTLMRVAPVKNREQEIFAVMILLTDITEIKKTQAELATLNQNLESRVAERTEQLYRVNAELESFTYSVSHDLRAPLRSIAGHAQILDEDHKESMNEEGVAALHTISRNAMRMGQLIDDLLEFSRMGRKELSSTVIDMNELVQQVFDELTQLDKNRDTKISIADLPTAKGDLSMIRQVWINLISNAIKYSRNKPSTAIEITAYEAEGRQGYSIRDYGAGFDMAYANKLFGVFQRLHKAKEFEGTGVGLALVKTIIARHGGTVGAEGQLNQGARFYFTLPTH